ncbi:MAG TPA: glycoside hydrolase family 3 N-terminal domain-containing protein [Pyrinomonadaceae bacterium]|jgi:beta-glucosidase|nr:glycoside hydrolase family 3 N-terminal domain-containing protein [Pyrinomonadaceae bacterium]
MLLQAVVSSLAQSADVYSDAVFSEVSQRPKRADHSAEIESLIRRMTIEEKVGQMTQLTINMVTTGDHQAIAIEPAKLEKAVVKYGVGSLLNVNNQAITLDHWHRIIGPIQQAAQRTRLKIPVIYGIDSIHGANYVQGSTLFPQEIGMAATWNPALMKQAAEITAMETRAAGIPWSFSPVLDVGRKQMWPRFWETFGEDPYLASVMGTAFVRGLEGDDVTSGRHVAASLKHYVGYSLPLTGRDRTPAWIPENYLREYFLPPFAAAIKAGARTVMVNSAEINGVPGHINKHLLTDVLKGELAFDGFIVSDWEDIKKLVTQWHVAADEKAATRLAVMAGIDMSMVPLSYSFSDNLIELVKEKKVPMSRIDDAVRRILRVKFDLGLFKNAMPDDSLRANFGKAEYAALGLQAARESIVLLKNSSNILPLSKNAKVLVTGPTADSLISLNNGWTYVWQGSEPTLYPKDKPTIQKAIEAKLGASNWLHLPGTRIIRKPNSASNSSPTDIDKEVDVQAAVNAAKKSDVVVLCLGEGSYTESPGSIADLTLGEIQLKFAESIIATGKPVVLVLAEGRPRVISQIADQVAAIVLAPNPGNEGGRAVADVLFGDYNPDGKLPFTYPRSPGYLTTYDADPFDRVLDANKPSNFQPQFEFGSGLSYTSFQYSDLKFSSTEILRSRPIKASVKVTNTGQRSGQETVILYVRDEVASITPAAKRVRRFAKVGLAAGESKTVEFTLRPEDLSYVGLDNNPTIEPGEFTVMVGGQSAKFTLR